MNDVVKLAFPEVVEFAKLLDKSEAIQEAVDTRLEADKIIKQGAVGMLLQLQDVLGDKINELPRFGTTDRMEGVNNPEIRHVRRQKSNGSWDNDHKVSFYDELLEATVRGREIKVRLAAIVQAGKEEKSGIKDIDDMNGFQLGEERKRLAAMKSAQRNLIISAAKLHFIMSDINDMPDMECTIRTDADGTVVKGHDCIWVNPIKDPVGGKWMTVPEVLRLDPKLAMEEGYDGHPKGSYKALFATGKRKNGASTADEKASTKTVKVSDINDLLATLAVYVDKTEDASDNLTRFISKHPDKDREHLIVTLTETANFLTGVAQTFHSEYKAIKEDESNKRAAAIRQRNAA